MNQRPNRVDRGVRCGGCLLGSSPRSVRFQFVGKVGNFWLQPMGQEPTPISLTVRAVAVGARHKKPARPLYRNGGLLHAIGHSEAQNKNQCVAE
jgi:hypothetical protein